MEPGLNLAYLVSMINRHPPPGRRVLELGADAKSARCLQGALREHDYVGVDLAPSSEDRKVGIVQGDAHKLKFPDDAYDAVISVSMFEHDPRFWLSLDEIRRVLAPEGIFFVSVQGYSGKISKPAQAARRVRNRLRKTGLPRLAALVGSAVITRTYPSPMAPHDYYRFSPTAVQEVLLNGFDVLELRTVLSPPTIQAAGRLTPP